MSMYKLTQNPDIVEKIDPPMSIPRGSRDWDSYTEWVADGNTPLALQEPTFADYVAEFTSGLQAWMESVAQSNAYDSVVSCVSYENDEVAQFACDALAMRRWRSALRKWASEWQAGFNGKLPAVIPTLEEVIALAPQPEAFGWVVHPKDNIIESHTSPVQTS